MISLNINANNWIEKMRMYKYSMTVISELTISTVNNNSTLHILNKNPKVAYTIRTKTAKCRDAKIRRVR